MNETDIQKIIDQVLGKNGGVPISVQISNTELLKIGAAVFVAMAAANLITKK